MDRKQLVVERTRALFAERLDDVLHMVRQDRQDLRGWEEPAHVRAVLRRSIRAGRLGCSRALGATMPASRTPDEPDERRRHLFPATQRMRRRL